MKNPEGMDETLLSKAERRDTAVHVQGLRKHYGEVHAVKEVDLTIKAGEVVALLGPNGAGKSTMVDMIVGLTTPDSGIVRVFGLPPRQAVLEGVIGAMLQEGALLDDATVIEMVGMVASLHKNPLPVREALRKAGIEELARRRSTKLSTGQKQRVRFAVALVADPDLLLLDEPTAGMDVRRRHEFWHSMQEFTASGRTVMFATHYLEEAEEFADRVVFLRDGRIVADGSVAQVRSLAAGRTLRATISGVSEPAMRALPSVVNVEIRQDKVAVLSSDSDTTLRALLSRFPHARDVEVVGVGLDEAFLALTSRTRTSEGELS
ncbi:ABC transporter ATP-binding protein [Nonomuraea jiangxiensis]|uniref:ABC transporter ATP-binding protein n=1 Tax=Nonomuraea jiangxiensis TaxID=633440 RepID=UPI001FE68E73|nr:ABC transporter ATP-binding protein [Nonomuraea jiangxiensis]